MKKLPQFIALACLIAFGGQFALVKAQDKNKDNREKVTVNGIEFRIDGNRLIKTLCSQIAKMSLDEFPNEFYEYEYQRTVFESAGVDIKNDAEEVRLMKIRTMWKKYQYQVICEDSAFQGVGKGSFIKRAVSTGFDVFIWESLDWDLDLEWKENGSTLMEYVKMLKDKEKVGSRLYNKYDAYEQLFQRQIDAKKKLQNKK